MNGTINVTSAPGAGASFIVSLPAQTGIPQEKISATENIMTGKDDLPLVIVVEDHEQLNSFVAQSLQMEGYRCMQAFNGKEAWQLIQQYVPDLIVSDLMMPQLSGEELVGLVRSNELTSHIPMIILTAKNQVSNRVELYQTGADNYIAKPFKMEELLAVIDNTLTQRKRVMDKFYKAYLDNSIPAATTIIISDEHEEAPVNNIVQLCTDYVLAHLEDPDLNVNTLGTAMGMGRNRLQKEIKAGTSLTPVEFIRSIRLHQAYKLLREAPQYNISEIAYKTGFSNLSYFSRSFKMQFGIAPTNMNKKIIQ